MTDTMTSARERIGKLDIAIATVAGMLAVASALADYFDDKVDGSWVAVPLFVGVAVPLLWRRVAPLAALAATLGALLLHVALFGDHAVRCGVVFPVALLLAWPSSRSWSRAPPEVGSA
ncbi:MAG: hypothetical protein ACJ766_16910 [Thermoleophilaceae bacterium]